MKTLLGQDPYATMVLEEADGKADQQRVFESRLCQKIALKSPPTVTELRQRRQGDESMHEFPQGENPVCKFAALLQQAMRIQDLSLVSYSAMYHNLSVDWHADDWGVGQCFAIVKFGPTAHDVLFAMQHAKKANSKDILVFRAQGDSISLAFQSQHIICNWVHINVLPVVAHYLLLLTACAQKLRCT